MEGIIEEDDSLSGGPSYTALAPVAQPKMRAHGSMARPQPIVPTESKLPALACQVHPWLQVFVPVAIVGLICLFISADFGWGTETILEVQIADMDVQLELGKSTFAKTMQEFKKYGLWWMYVGQLLSHALFPYINLSVLFIVWFLPNKWLCSYYRGWFLEFVHYFTKFTFGNLIIYIFIMCCVNFNIRNEREWSEVLLLPSGFIEIELRVYPLYSLYCTVIGNALAQGIAYIMLIVHRRAAG